MFSKMFDKASNLTCRLKRDQNGAVLIQVALSSFVLIGMLGIGVDMGRAYLYRAQLSAALDAAALAGSKAFHSDTRDAEIQAFFDSNFDADFMGGKIKPLNIIPGNAAQRTLSVTTSGTVDTAFMRLFGYDELSVGVAAETTARQSGLELVMVLDTTGSMRSEGDKMASLKVSATSMIDSLFGDDPTNENLRVSVVPYVTSVNVGSVLPAAYVDRSGDASASPPIADVPASYIFDTDILGAYDPATPTTPDYSKWFGCVEARKTNVDLTAADAYDVQVEHNGVGWRPFLWRPHYDKPYNIDGVAGPNGETGWDAPSHNLAGGAGESPYHSGPNLTCPRPIMPFSNNQQDIKDYIDTLQYTYNRGGTISTMGMMWGWRMLHTGTPLMNDNPYANPNMPKAIILMTDGVNWIYDSSGKHPYYDGTNDYYDNNDAFDDDGDGKCPQCTGTFVNNKGKTKSNARYDGGDEAAYDANLYYGYYRYDYSAYGRAEEGRLDGATYRNATTPKINKRLGHICAAVKGMGITVYTITFGNGASNGALRDLYKGCATDTGKYFHAPSASDLDTAFEEIANDLTDLRLSK